MKYVIVEYGLSFRPVFVASSFSRHVPKQLLGRALNNWIIDKSLVRQ